MLDIYKNDEGYNPGRKYNVLIVFDDMIANMFNNKKLSPVVTKLFIRGKKIFLPFLSHNFILQP